MKTVAEPAVTAGALLTRTLRENTAILGATDILSEFLGITAEEVTEMLDKGGGFHEVIRLSDYARQALPHMTERRSRLIGLLNRWSQLLNSVTINDNPQIRYAADVANLLMAEMRLLEKEELRVIALDTKHRIKGMETVYQGSLNAASVRVGEIFRLPITRLAASAVVVHNHPSGDPTPSPEDVQVTELLVEAGSLLDISVIDHVIIGNNRFVSLRERGLGFK